MSITQQRLLLRFFRLASILISSAIIAWSTWQIVGNRAGQLLVERSVDEISLAYTKLINRELSQIALEQRIQQELLVGDRNWMLLQSLRDISVQQDYQLSQQTEDLWSIASSEDHSLLNSSKDCMLCMWSSKACESSAAMACGLALNFTPIGDVGGLARASVAFANGEDIDEIDVALSAVGIGATVVVFTPAAAAGVSTKIGAGFLKFANLTRSIPQPILRALRSAAKEGVDWAKLRTSKSVADVSQSLRPHVIAPIRESAESLGRIKSNTGANQALHLLQSADSIAELKQIARATEALESKTSGYIALFGKNRILRITVRVADEVYYMLTGIFGLFVSIFFGLIQLALDRALRRIKGDVSHRR